MLLLWNYWMATNLQTKENLLIQFDEIENNFKNSINTGRKRRGTRAIPAIKQNPKYICKFVKINSTLRAGIGPLQDEEGNLEPSNKKMSELLDDQYNCVFSTPDPTMTIKIPKFFGHPQANTLSDINIAREDIIDAIKTISQNSSGGPDEFPEMLLKQFSKSLAIPLQLMYKASLKTGEIPIDLNEPLLHQSTYKGGPRNLPKNYRPVALTSDLIKILEKY